MFKWVSIILIFTTSASFGFYKSYEIRQRKEILSDFESKYPVWKGNRFIKELPVYNRIFLKFADKKIFVGLKILSIIHSLLVRN